MGTARARPSAARTPSRYLLYWGVRVQNETGHKWTPRYGSPLFGKISPDRRSAVAVRPSLLYVPSFIGGAREKEEEKGGSSGTRGGIRCFYEFTLSLFRPPPPPLSLFASASRTKIFETRARTLALAYPPPSSPFPTITSSFFFFRFF